MTSRFSILTTCFHFLLWYHTEDNWLYKQFLYSSTIKPTDKLFPLQYLVHWYTLNNKQQRTSKEKALACSLFLPISPPPDHLKLLTWHPWTQIQGIELALHRWYEITLTSIKQNLYLHQFLSSKDFKLLTWLVLPQGILHYLWLL